MNVKTIKRAIAFYEGSPTGQYDDEAVEALRALLALKVEQPASLSDQDAALINQAHDMLLAYADDQRGKGNDCAAMGAECSADAVLRLWAAASVVDEQPAAQGEPVAWLVRATSPDVQQRHWRDWRVLTTGGEYSPYPDDDPCYKDELTLISLRAKKIMELANIRIAAGQRPDFELRPLYTHPSPAAQVPEGWSLSTSQSGHSLIVRDPYGNWLSLGKHETSMANMLLYGLASALLSASPKPPEPPAQAVEQAVAAEPKPPAKINRLCKAGLCIDADSSHEPDCKWATPGVQAEKGGAQAVEQAVKGGAL